MENEVISGKQLMLMKAKHPKRNPLDLPPCSICGGKANGIHFGVNACLGCKAFFHRFLKRKSPYVCKNGGHCKIVDSHRGNCPACRMDKCLAMGMSRDGIRMGRYTLTERTIKINEVKRLQRSKEDLRIEDSNGEIDPQQHLQVNGSKQYGDSMAANLSEKRTNHLIPHDLQLGEGNHRNNKIPERTTLGDLVCKGQGQESEVSLPPQDIEKKMQCNKKSKTCSILNLILEKHAKYEKEEHAQSQKLSENNVSSKLNLKELILETGCENVNLSQVATGQISSHPLSVMTSIDRDVISLGEELDIFVSTDFNNSYESEENSNDFHKNMLSNFCETVENGENFCKNWENASSHFPSKGIISPDFLEKLTSAYIQTEVVPELSKAEIDAMLREAYDNYQMEVQLYGPMKALSLEEYKNFRKETGMDIDGRQAYLERASATEIIFMKQLIDFAYEIPGFSEIDPEDQAALMKHSMLELDLQSQQRGAYLELEMCLTRTRDMFHLDQMCMFESRDECQKYFTMYEYMQDLRLTETELALMMGINLTFADRCKLKNSKKVEEVQFFLITHLQENLKQRLGDAAEKKFTKIMDLFIRLRLFSDRCSKKWHELYKDEYLQEIFQHIECNLVETVCT